MAVSGYDLLGINKSLATLQEQAQYIRVDTVVYVVSLT